MRRSDFEELGDTDNCPRKVEEEPHYSDVESKRPAGRDTHGKISDRTDQKEEDTATRTQDHYGPDIMQTRKVGETASISDNTPALTETPLVPSGLKRPSTDATLTSLKAFALAMLLPNLYSMYLKITFPRFASLQLKVQLREY